MNAEKTYQQIRKDKIITIVRGFGADVIVDIARALRAAGITMLEVTCNTEGFADIIARLVSEMQPEMTIGAGTVITKSLCQEAVSAGAQYIIAPDVNPEVISYCVESDIPVLPGAYTPTEILAAKRLGARVVKLFPAGQMPTGYIKALTGPIDDVEFVAVGGVRPNNIAGFFDAGCVAIGIGGSIVRREWVQAGDFQAITDETKKYVAAVAAAAS